MTFSLYSAVHIGIVSLVIVVQLLGVENRFAKSSADNIS